MAYARKLKFSDFSKEKGLAVYLPQGVCKAGNHVGAQIVSGMNSGYVRCSESFIHQVLRWASEETDCLVDWDNAVNSEYDFTKYLEILRVLEGKPTDCTLEPGDAYLMEYTFTDNKRPRPIMPQKRDDGSYAYCALQMSMLDPDEWKQQARDCGFMVRVSSDGACFYGSRFPGGVQNYSPPISLIPWMSLALAQSRLCPPPRPALVRSSSSPMIGTKAALKIPDFGSCKELKEAVRTRRAVDIQAVLDSVPEPILKQAHEVSPKMRRSIIKIMEDFVKGRAQCGDNTYFSTFLSKLRSVAAGEPQYCVMIEEFGERFAVDWEDQAKVSVLDDDSD